MESPLFPSTNNISAEEQFIQLVENLSVGVVKHLPDAIKVIVIKTND